MEPIKEQQFDLRDYFRILLKRRWIIITIFTLVVTAVAVNTFTAVPIFQATARILIEKENPNLMSIEEVMAVDATGTDYYQTQYKILESRSLAREVIRRLNLENSAEFFPAPKDDIVSNAKRWIVGMAGQSKQWVVSIVNAGEQNLSVKKRIPENGTKYMEDSGLVNDLISRIGIKPIRNSRLVDVSVEAKDPAMAAEIANEVVQVYIDHNMELKLRAAKDAVKWLMARIEEERKKVEDAENALLEYKEQHEIITDFSSDAENITAEKLAQLNSRVVEAESQRVEAETRYRQAVALVKTPELLDSIPEVLSNALVQDIKRMEVDLSNRMSELSKKYGKNHPQMVAVRSELEELEKRKITEAKRVVNSLRNEYKLALAREESLKQALGRQKSESLDMNKKAIRYGVLWRQAESSRHMYELLIKRFKETSLTEEMKTGNIRMVDKAEIPSVPVKPQKKRNVLLAMLIGLSLGVGLAFLLEYMDNTIKNPDELKEHLRIPYLGPIPAFDTNEKTDTAMVDLITVHSPKSTVSESFRGIRTGILFSSADTVPQVILVTSAEPSEGKTMCASNLAVTMAQSGTSVAILDCDLRRPKVHSVFRVGKETGVSSILVGKADVEETTVKSDIENLDIIPCGPTPPNPSEILGSMRMRELLESLRKKYSRIIIDTPPITAVTDAVVLAQIVDGIVMVMRAGAVPKQVVQNSVEQLKSVNVNILGGVLNEVDTGRDNYYYYNRQYYYYYYGKSGKDKN